MVDEKNQELELDVTVQDEQAIDQLMACQEQRAQWKEKFQYVSADFENFRRRMEKEKVQWMAVAQSGLMKELLPVMDDFERALQQQQKQELSEPMREWLSGFMMIGAALEKILKAAGLQEITQMKTFDPVLHEAVAHVESAEHVAGSLVSVLQKGYMFKDQVIRPALVSVAK
jgi:molecular chaperone GrpE